LVCIRLHRRLIYKELFTAPIYMYTYSQLTLCGRDSFAICISIHSSYYSYSYSQLTWYCRGTPMSICILFTAPIPIYIYIHSAPCAGGTPLRCAARRSGSDFYFYSYSQLTWYCRNYGRNSSLLRIGLHSFYSIYTYIYSQRTLCGRNSFAICDALCVVPYFYFYSFSQLTWYCRNYGRNSSLLGIGLHSSYF